MQAGDNIDFEVIAEPWTQVSLPDGTTIRVRLIVTNVILGDGVDPDGHQNIMVRSTNVVSVLWPPKDDHPLPLSSSAKPN